MSGELPEGWSWLTLEQFAATEPHAITDGPFGSNLKTADYVEGGEVRVIRLGNIGVGRFVDEDRSFISAAKFAGLTKHEARAGDLVVAALAEPVGRCAEVPEGIGTAIVKADCVRVRVNPRFDRRYLMHALNSPAGRLRAEAAAHGMGRLRMNLGDLRNLVVPTAPPTEQRRIVAKLEALQARSRRAKEALDTVPALLEKLRQSILAAAFRGDLTKDWRAQNPNVEPASELLKRIRAERRAKWEGAELAKLKAKGKTPSDDKWKAKYKDPEPVDPTGLPALPEGWCVTELGEVVWRLTNGYVGPTRDIYFPSGVPYLLSKHVKRNALRFDRETFISEEFNQRNRKSILRAGDVLLVQTGHVGESAPVPDEHAGHNCHAMIVISPVSSVLDGRYLSLFFEAPPTRLALGAMEKGMTLRHLNCHDVIRLPTLVPPLEEQREIVARLQQRLADLDLVRDRVVEHSRQLVDLDRSTLAKAFRGELVRQDPSEGSASGEETAQYGRADEVASVPKRGRKLKGA